MRSIVIGVGNVLFKDEGVGVYAARYLEKNYSFNPEVEVIDGGTLGFKLMCYLQEYDHVVILDTISIDDEVGSVYVIPGEEMLGMGQYRKTAHEVEIVQMLEICSLLGKIAEVTIIGVIPEDIETVEIGLTDAMTKTFGGYVGAVEKDLRAKGYELTKKSEVVALEDIIGAWHEERISADG